MDAAATAAAEARERLRGSFASGRTRPAAWREAQLRGLLRMATEREDDICAALQSDLAKPRTECYVHEISLVTSSCKFALKNLKKWMKSRKVPGGLLTFPSAGSVAAEPLGVVLVISAWNYPFLLAMDPVVGAIAAGNAVALKPSEVAPATSWLLADLLPRYVDPSCVRVVQGGIPETTALLELQWDKIFYTGNSRVGRIVMSYAAAHLTPVVLELGGKCPVVVDSDVNLHKKRERERWKCNSINNKQLTTDSSQCWMKVAARRIAAGKWGCNSGQACVSPDYIVTTKSFAPKLLESLKRVLREFYGEDPLRSPDLSRVVNSNHFNRIMALMGDEAVSGKIAFGGKTDERQLRIAPTLLLDVPLDSAMMKEEIFGPLLPIITVDKIGESFAVINSMAKPLAAYLFTNDSQLKQQFERNVSAGGIMFNDTGIHLTNPHLPFGGVGESGMGAYHGAFSFDAFTHRKAVLDRSFLGEAKARYPPYTPAKLRILRGVLKGNPLAVVQAAVGCTGGGGA